MQIVNLKRNRIEDITPISENTPQNRIKKDKDKENIELSQIVFDRLLVESTTNTPNTPNPYRYIKKDSGEYGEYVNHWKLYKEIEIKNDKDAKINYFPISVTRGNYGGTTKTDSNNLTELLNQLEYFEPEIFKGYTIGFICPFCGKSLKRIIKNRKRKTHPTHTHKNKKIPLIISYIKNEKGVIGYHYLDDYKNPTNTPRLHPHKTSKIILQPTKKIKETENYLKRIGVFPKREKRIGFLSPLISDYYNLPLNQIDDYTIIPDISKTPNTNTQIVATRRKNTK